MFKSLLSKALKRRVVLNSFLKSYFVSADLGTTLATKSDFLLKIPKHYALMACLLFFFLFFFFNYCIFLLNS